jgi:hypothetical protein
MDWTKRKLLGKCAMIAHQAVHFRNSLKCWNQSVTVEAVFLLSFAIVVVITNSK